MMAVLRPFASLKLTVVWLLTMAGILALGTIYEAENGTPAVKVVFWRTTWFNGLLLILGLNILACTYLRRPKRTSRWAYLLLHNSILVIFAGGLIGRAWGIEGTLAFLEGDTRAYILSEANILYARWSGGEEQRIPTELADAFPRRHTVDTSSMGRALLARLGLPLAPRPLSTPLGDHGVIVAVDRYLPHYQEVASAVEGGAGDGPAVWVELAMGGETLREWLFARPAGSGVTVAGMRLALEEGAPPALERGARGAGQGGILELEGGDHAFHVKLPVDGRVGQELAVPGTKFTVTVRQIFTHFRMSGKQPVDDPSGPENPAVVFVIAGPGLRPEPRIAFARYPDFDVMHGRQESGIKARYRYQPRRLTLYRDGATGAMRARLETASQTTTGPIEPEKGYPIPDVPGLTLRVLRAMSRARAGTEAVSVSLEVKNPAIHVRASTAAGETGFWLTMGASRTIALGPRRLTLEYGKERVDLGFELKLEKFEVGRYPGTNQPSSFASTVWLKDTQRRIDERRLISMNEPLVHRRFTFYQSSYVEGPKMTSVLQVAYDPGAPVAYLGFVGFILGLFCIITSRAPRTVKPGGGPPPGERDEVDEPAPGLARPVPPDAALASAQGPT